MKRTNNGNPPARSTERVVVDFQATALGVPLEVAKVNYSRAHMPLSRHVHGGMEFVYVAKGRQYYRVAGEEHIVESGELFFTRAGEPHDSSARPEEKSLFYYLIVDVPALCDGYLGWGDEGQALALALAAMQRRVFRARHDARRLLDGMLACALTQPPFAATTLRNLLSAFLMGAIESERRHGADKPVSMQPVLGYIEERIEEDISLEELANLANLSLPRFKASFRRQAGIPPREFVLRRKVERAKALLALPELTVTDVAYRLQFSSSQYFATVFKRYAYVTPTQYRESLIHAKRRDFAPSGAPKGLRSPFGNLRHHFYIIP